MACRRIQMHFFPVCIYRRAVPIFPLYTFPIPPSPYMRVLTYMHKAPITKRGDIWGEIDAQVVWFVCYCGCGEIEIEREDQIMEQLQKALSKCASFPFLFNPSFPGSNCNEISAVRMDGRRGELAGNDRGRRRKESKES